MGNIDEKIIIRKNFKNPEMTYAYLYRNIKELFDDIKKTYPDMSYLEYPIPIQIYNKTNNVEKDMTTSHDIEDLYHGSIEEISKQYDKIMERMCEKEQNR